MSNRYIVTISYLKKNVKLMLKSGNYFVVSRFIFNFAHRNQK